MTKVIICGGRNYTNTEEAKASLNELHKEHNITEVISGHAFGADRCGETWARGKGIPVREFPADWRTHRRSAGAMRNAQMLKEGQPDLVIAFPGGAGTLNMVRQAGVSGVPVVEVPHQKKTEPETFTFGELLYNHRVGDQDCGEGWCGASNYPTRCECSGLIHADFGDENDDGDYWLREACDKCGEDYAPAETKS